MPDLPTLVEYICAFICPTDLPKLEIPFVYTSTDGFFDAQKPLDLRGSGRGSGCEESGIGFQSLNTC